MSWACLLCQGEEKITYKDTLRDASVMRIVRCMQCGHIQLHPVPSEEELRTYYRDETQRKTALPGMTRDEKRTHVEMDTARRVRFIESQFSGYILDIGGGDGFFAEALRENDIDVHEHDMKDGRLYDFVTAFHVLEHVRNPIDTLSEWWEYVQKDGWLVLEVPNVADAMLQTNTPYWDWYFQRAHLHYFDAQHLWSAVFHANIVYRSVKFFGVQRYSLGNHVRWRERRIPDRIMPIGSYAEWCSTEANQEYCTALERRLTCDTLMLCLQK